MTAEEIVFSANNRCNQENLIAQLKSGVRALTAPVDDLVSNWAYMVMASLAWSLKAWSGFCSYRYRLDMGRSTTRKYESCVRMEFATFCTAFIQMPCQINARRTAIDLPAAVLESVASGLPTTSQSGFTGAGSAEEEEPEIRVRMPRSPWAIE